MFDSTLLLILVAAILGFIGGYAVSNFWNRVVFREILKDLGVSDQQLLDLANSKEELIKNRAQPTPRLAEMEVCIEEHGGELFAFRKDNGQFLGQGQDREALIQRLTENLSNVRIVVDYSDGADFLLPNKNS